MHKARTTLPAIVPLMLSIFMTGCGKEARTTGPNRPSASAPSSSEGTQASASAQIEPDWQSQVSAVESGNADRIILTQHAVSDEDLQLMPALPALRTLMLDAGRIGDAGASELKKHGSLQQLRLRQSPITDGGMRSISEIRSLQNLNLPQADCSAEGIASLQSLPQLKMLRIGGARLDGAATANALTKLTRLQHLHSIQIPLNDSDLMRLVELENLRSLYVDGAEVTDAGWGAFFHARPDVHVHIDQSHHDLDPNRHD